LSFNHIGKKEKLQTKNTTVLDFTPNYVGIITGVLYSFVFIKSKHAVLLEARTHLTVLLGNWNSAVQLTACPPQAKSHEKSS